ncbi:MAG TPA: DUF4267 domain-containing protein [Hyphomicrobium sp.]|nr:DUF4267 domain-containing protein [Hyphomicrobium sp.]
MPALAKIVRVVAVLAGVLLAVIGARFLVDPLQAQRTFGLGKGDAGFALHWAIGLRDLWLALIVAAFAWLKNWQGLALWFAFGAAVCAGDGLIVAVAGARWPYIGFHMGSGMVCAGLAIAAWRAARTRPRP